MKYFIVIKLFFEIISFFLVFALCQAPIFSQFSGGDGTKNNPYQITSRQDMEALADSVNNSTISRDYNWSDGKYFILMNDITDSVRSVIGKDTSITANCCFFQGNFDGRGHTITLAITNANNSCAGLFGAVGRYNVAVNSAWISNVAVNGYVINEENIKIPDNYYSRTGGIVGFAFNDVKITNCINGADIIGLAWTGGIVGFMIGDNIVEKCINIGTIESIGKTSDWSTMVDTSSWAAGGIAGLNFFNGTINNCINSGFIEGKDFVGGIIGNNKYSTVSNCINTSVVKGKGKVGCIVGENNGGTIINCHYDKQMCGGGE